MRLDITKRYGLSFVVLLSLLLTACQPKFTDQSEEMKAQAIRIRANVVNSSLVWLDENRLAFMQDNEDTKITWDNTLNIAYIGTDDQVQLPFPDRTEQCEERELITVGNLRRLSNGNLGFILRCSSLELGVREELYMWDIEADELHLLFDFSKDGGGKLPPISYTFAPDMSVLIYGKSGGIGGETYRVDQDKPVQRILPDFVRTNDPNWSPDGKTIAFMGTRTYDGVHPDDFSSYEEARQLLFHPWDIYLMNAEGGNVRLIFEGITDPRGIEWVPSSNRYLSLVGDYNDVSGIWLLDTETKQLSRIWDEWSAYSWSPDGTQLIIMEKIEENGRKSSYPVVIGSPIPPDHDNADGS
jgi:hypothetical protein